jgi:hypothetical protein
VNLRHNLIVLGFIAAALWVTTAQADVTRKHKVAAQFWGANEGTTADYYATDRHASESTLRWTKGMMKTFTGGKPAESAQIIRLDKERVWTVNPKDKTYTEMTFAEFRDAIKKGQEASKNEEQVPDTVKEDMYNWKVVDLSEAGPKIINGWNCRNVHIEATGTNKHDSLDQVIITLNTWNSETVPGASEIQDFNLKYLKALGLNDLALTENLMAATMLYRRQFDSIMESARKAPGEAVQSLVEIKRNQLKTKSIGNAAKDEAANELMGKLPFGKKKAPKEEAPQYELRTKYSVSSELTEASTTAVDAGKFEIPAGFKKK